MACRVTTQTAPGRRHNLRTGETLGRSKGQRVDILGLLVLPLPPESATGGAFRGRILGCCPGQAGRRPTLGCLRDGEKIFERLRQRKHRQQGSVWVQKCECRATQTLISAQFVASAYSTQHLASKSLEDLGERGTEEAGQMRDAVRRPSCRDGHSEEVQRKQGCKPCDFRTSSTPSSFSS